MMVPKTGTGGNQLRRSDVSRFRLEEEESLFKTEILWITFYKCQSQSEDVDL